MIASKNAQSANQEKAIEMVMIGKNIELFSKITIHDKQAMQV